MTETELQDPQVYAQIYQSVARLRQALPPPSPRLIVQMLSTDLHDLLQDAERAAQDAFRAVRQIEALQEQVSRLTLTLRDTEAGLAELTGGLPSVESVLRSDR